MPKPPISSQDTCFLTIDVPRDNDKGPLVMEQVLATIHGLNAKVSLEIWSTNNKIQLALWCKIIHREFLLHQLEAHYHGIAIREADDITRSLAQCYTADLKLNAAPIFPVRRYSQTVDIVERAWADPYLGILATLKTSYSKETRGIQM